MAEAKKSGDSGVEMESDLDAEISAIHPPDVQRERGRSRKRTGMDSLKVKASDAMDDVKQKVSSLIPERPTLSPRQQSRSRSSSRSRSRTRDRFELDEDAALAFYSGNTEDDEESYMGRSVRTDGSGHSRRQTTGLDILKSNAAVTGDHVKQQLLGLIPDRPRQRSRSRSKSRSRTRQLEASEVSSEFGEAASEYGGSSYGKKQTGFDILKVKAADATHQMKQKVASLIPERPKVNPRSKSRSRSNLKMAGSKRDVRGENAEETQSSEHGTEVEGESQVKKQTGLDILKLKATDATDNLKQRITSVIPEPRSRSRTRPQSRVSHGSERESNVDDEEVCVGSLKVNLEKGEDALSIGNMTESGRLQKQTGLDLLRLNVADATEHIKQQIKSVIPEPPKAPPRQRSRSKTRQQNKMEDPDQDGNEEETKGEEKEKVEKAEVVPKQTGLDILKSKADSVKQRINLAIPEPPKVRPRQRSQSRTRPHSRAPSAEPDAEYPEKEEYAESIGNTTEGGQRSKQTGMDILKLKIEGVSDNMKLKITSAIPEPHKIRPRDRSRVRTRPQSRATSVAPDGISLCSRDENYTESVGNTTEGGHRVKQTTGFDILRSKIEDTTGNVKLRIASVIPDPPKYRPKPKSTSGTRPHSRATSVAPDEEDENAEKVEYAESFTTYGGQRVKQTTGFDILRSKTTDTLNNVKERIHLAIPEPPKMRPKPKSRSGTRPHSRATSVAPDEEGENAENVEYAESIANTTEIGQRVKQTTGFDILRSKIEDTTGNVKLRIASVIPDPPKYRPKPKSTSGTRPHSRATSVAPDEEDENAEKVEYAESITTEGGQRVKQTTGFDILRSKTTDTLNNVKERIHLAIPEPPKMRPKPRSRSPARPHSRASSMGPDDAEGKEDDQHSIGNTTEDGGYRKKTTGFDILKSKAEHVKEQIASAIPEHPVVKAGTLKRSRSKTRTLQRDRAQAGEPEAEAQPEGENTEELKEPIADPGLGHCETKSGKEEEEKVEKLDIAMTTEEVTVIMDPIRADVTATEANANEVVECQLEAVAPETTEASSAQPDPPESSKFPNPITSLLNQVEEFKNKLRQSRPPPMRKIKKNTLSRSRSTIASRTPSQIHLGALDDNFDLEVGDKLERYTNSEMGESGMSGRRHTGMDILKSKADQVKQRIKSVVPERPKVSPGQLSRSRSKTKLPNRSKPELEPAPSNMERYSAEFSDYENEMGGAFEITVVDAEEMKNGIVIIVEDYSATDDNDADVSITQEDATYLEGSQFGGSTSTTKRKFAQQRRRGIDNIPNPMETLRNKVDDFKTKLAEKRERIPTRTKRRATRGGKRCMSRSTIATTSSVMSLEPDDIWYGPVEEDSEMGEDDRRSWKTDGSAYRRQTGMDILKSKATDTTDSLKQRMASVIPERRRLRPGQKLKRSRSSRSTSRSRQAMGKDVHQEEGDGSSAGDEEKVEKVTMTIMNEEMTVIKEKVKDKEGDGGDATATTPTTKRRRPQRPRQIDQIPNPLTSLANKVDDFKNQLKSKTLPRRKVNKRTQSRSAHASRASSVEPECCFEEGDEEDQANQSKNRKLDGVSSEIGKEILVKGMSDSQSSLEQTSIERTVGIRRFDRIEQFDLEERLSPTPVPSGAVIYSVSIYPTDTEDESEAIVGKLTIEPILKYNSQELTISRPQSPSQNLSDDR